MVLDGIDGIDGFDGTNGTNGTGRDEQGGGTSGVRPPSDRPPLTRWEGVEGFPGDSYDDE